MQNATLYTLFNIFRSIVDEETLGEATVGLPWPPTATHFRPVSEEPWCTQHGSPDLAIRFKISVVDRPLETADPNLLHIPAHRDRPFRLNVTACSGLS